MCLVLADGAVSINQCGGKRTLSQRVGDTCDSGPHALCATGVLVCHGVNSLVCVPSCDSKQVVKEAAECICEDQLLFCKQTECGVGGVCSDAHERCVCLPGYSGERCESRNACAQLDCGQHGVCVHAPDTEARCRCDEGYGGEYCRQHTLCLPGGKWDEAKRQCACKPGYTGEFCDQCDVDGLCVPTRHADDPFVLIHVPPEIRAEMLAAETLPEYTYAPIEPASTHAGVLYGCGCKAERSSGVSLEENIVDADLYYYGGHDSTYNYYPHDYYGSYYDHYTYRRTCYAGSGVAVLLWLVVVFFVFLFFYSAIYADPATTHTHVASAHVDVLTHRVGDAYTSPATTRKRNVPAGGFGGNEFLV